MTEPDPDEQRPVGWAPPPTVPGEILVRVTHPDDPLPTCTVQEAKEPQRRRWRCPCGTKGKAAMETLARAELYAHRDVCRLNPAVAAGVEAARAASRARR